VCTEVDLYFAPFDNVFTVHVDPLTGVHNVSVDPAYRYERHSSDQVQRRTRRQLNNLTLSEDANSTQRVDNVYQLIETTASEFVTFVSVPHPDMFLVVRAVRNRLVIMLPNTAHHLKVSRFYLVLVGSASTSYGIVYFRQDQPHIDLFVFFSVFFSCFFLFLAACVLLWKAKQVVDRQRTRHRRQIEMQDMASRPFASVLVYMPHTEDHPQTDDPHTERLVRSTSQMTELSAREQRVGSGGFKLSPLATEPTRGGVAVVATFVLELPCSSTSAVRACLGSSLLTSRVLQSSSSSHYMTAKQSASRAASAAVT